MERKHHSRADLLCFSFSKSSPTQTPSVGDKSLLDLENPNDPHLCKLMDLHMALTLNGHERSQAEYDALYEQSGYKMDKSHFFPLSYIQEIWDYFTFTHGLSYLCSLCTLVIEFIFKDVTRLFMLNPAVIAPAMNQGCFIDDE